MTRAGVLLLALLLAAGSAVADQRDAVLRNLARCGDIADKQNRLACFDAETPNVKALTAATSSGAPSPVPRDNAAAAPAPSKAQQESWFGFSVLGGRKRPQTTPAQFGEERIAPAAHDVYSAAQPKELDSISGKVTAYALDPSGRFTVTLDNGQIWRQIGTTDRAHFRRGSAGANSVVITRGTLGCYWLRLNDGGAGFSVARAK